MRILIIVLIFFYTNQLIGQDTLVLMSGKHKSKLCVEKIDSSKVFYKRHKFCDDSISKKTKKISKDNVFEIRRSEGFIELLYKQDSSEFALTNSQAHSYINGCHNAMHYYHNRFVGPLCYILTLSSFFILPLVAVVGIPCAYTIGALLLTPSFKFDNIDEVKVDKFYIMGYHDTKKNKLIKSSIFFGISALISGFGIYYLTK